MLSVTSLSTFLYCPRKSFLEVVLKIKMPPKPAMVKGSVRHNAFDFINQGEEELIKSIKSTNLDEILMTFKKNHLECLKNAVVQNQDMIKELQIPVKELMKESWDTIIKETEEKAKNIHALIVERGVFGEELWNAIEIKTQSEVRIESESLKLRGIIDRIEMHPEEIIPIEFKTGSYPAAGVWPNHRVQIGSYILLLNEKHEKTKTGYIKYLDINSLRPVTMNAFLEKDILATRDSILNMKETVELPPFTEDKKKCEKCELKILCHSDEYIGKKMKEIK